MPRTIARVITVAALFLATASAQPALAAQGGTLAFIGPEIPLAPVIKGAPFSADATTQVTQTLADGTRIDQTTRGKLFRDSEGRVRREQTIRGLNALDPSIDGPTIVTIVDPVAGVRYVLDTRKKEARRVMSGPAFERQQAEAGLRRGARGLPPPPPPPPPPGGEPVPGPRAGSMSPPPSPPGPPPVGESLGTRQVEGLMANGTRNTLRLRQQMEGGMLVESRASRVYNLPGTGSIAALQHVIEPRANFIEIRGINQKANPQFEPGGGPSTGVDPGYEARTGIDAIANTSPLATSTSTAAPRTGRPQENCEQNAAGVGSKRGGGAVGAGPDDREPDLQLPSRLPALQGSDERGDGAAQRALPHQRECSVQCLQFGAPGRERGVQRHLQ